MRLLRAPSPPLCFCYGSGIGWLAREMGFWGEMGWGGGRVKREGGRYRSRRRRRRYYLGPKYLKALRAPSQSPVLYALQTRDEGMCRRAHREYVLSILSCRYFFNRPLPLLCLFLTHYHYPHIHTLLFFIPVLHLAGHFDSSLLYKYNGIRNILIIPL